MNKPVPLPSPRTVYWLWWAVTSLALLNLGLLAWLWLAPVRLAASPPALASSGPTFLADTLRFSASQRARYDTLRAQYLRQVQPVAQSCQQAGRRYGMLLTSTLPDSCLADSCRAALGSRVALDLLTVRHFQQVAALCTPQQRKLLQQVLLQVPARCGTPQVSGSAALRSVPAVR